jgi:hypothetical protein
LWYILHNYESFSYSLDMAVIIWYDVDNKRKETHMIIKTNDTVKINTNGYEIIGKVLTAHNYSYDEEAFQETKTIS